MISLKEYIILEEALSEVILTEELINEASEQLIEEGFIDKLKDAVDNLTSHPKEFVRKLVNDNDRSPVLSLAQKKFGKNIRNYLFPVDGVVMDDVMHELKKLNNDEDLKHIYTFTKDYINKKDGMTLVYWVIDHIEHPEKVKKVCDDIRSEFGEDISKDKIAAIFDIASCIGQAMMDKVKLAKYKKDLKHKKELNMSLTNQAVN